jgi:hypothetical protein
VRQGVRAFAKTVSFALVLSAGAPAAAHGLFAEIVTSGGLSTAAEKDPRAADVMADDAPGLFTRVRSTERFMIALIREGYERSPTFRELVDTLQQSNIIVFVQPAVCAGGRIRSCLVSVSGSAVQRHIRIKVDPRTSQNTLIATIGHELQHAIEIAEHPEVSDGSSALRLYRQIAFGRCHEGLSEECETARALVTEKKVLEELFARTPAATAGMRWPRRNRRLFAASPAATRGHGPW